MFPFIKDYGRRQGDFREEGHTVPPHLRIIYVKRDPRTEGEEPLSQHSL